MNIAAFNLAGFNLELGSAAGTRSVRIAGASGPSLPGAGAGLNAFLSLLSAAEEGSPDTPKKPQASQQQPGQTKQRAKENVSLVASQTASSGSGSQVWPLAAELPDSVKLTPLHLETALSTMVQNLAVPTEPGSATSLLPGSEESAQAHGESQQPSSNTAWTNGLSGQSDVPFTIAPIPDPGENPRLQAPLAFSLQLTPKASEPSLLPANSTGGTPVFVNVADTTLSGAKTIPDPASRLLSGNGRQSSPSAPGPRWRPTPVVNTTESEALAKTSPPPVVAANVGSRPIPVGIRIEALSQPSPTVLSTSAVASEQTPDGSTAIPAKPETDAPTDWASTITARASEKRNDTASGPTKDMILPASATAVGRQKSLLPNAFVADPASRSSESNGTPGEDSVQSETPSPVPISAFQPKSQTAAIEKSTLPESQQETVVSPEAYESRGTPREIGTQQLDGLQKRSTQRYGATASDNTRTDTKPIDAQPLDAKSTVVELSAAKLTEARKADAKPVDLELAATKRVDTKDFDPNLADAELIDTRRTGPQPGDARRIDIKPVETTPLEANMAGPEPSDPEPVTKPVDTKPDAELADSELAGVKTFPSKPVDTKPADAKLIDTKSTDTKPAETRPDTKPADTKPADAKPDETNPAEALRPSSGSFPTAAQPPTPPNISREPAKAPPVAPTQNAQEPDTDGMIKPAVARQISLKLEDADGSNVAVQFSERGGKVEVAVRTPDTQLSRSLGSGLGDLVTQLENRGYKTEAWTPSGARTTAFAHSSSEASGSQQQPSHSGSGNSKQERQAQGESNPRRQSRGKALFAQTLAEEDAGTE